MDEAFREVSVSGQVGEAYDLEALGLTLHTRLDSTIFTWITV
jgi:hypothetical protein